MIVTYYLDNRSNSRANTCVNARPLEGLYLLDNITIPPLEDMMVIHDKFVDRKALCQWQII